MAHEQRPTPPNDWLYKDDENTRQFRTAIYLPDGADEWPQCTDAEKEQWEAEHPQPEESQDNE